ncbi:MAG: glutaredoxin domain-containing protein [Anaerolineae bacterium]
MKEFLSQRGVSFVQRDVAEDEQALTELERLDVMTTPVTVIGSEVVIGFDRARFENPLNTQQEREG